MKVQKFIFNDFREITYLVYDEKSRETLIIDPGCNKESEKKRIVEYIEKYGLKPVAIVNTHGHLDHICCNKFLKDKYNVEILANEKELDNYRLAASVADFYGFPFEDSPLPDKYIQEGDEIAFGNSKLIVFETPGHTAGSISLISPEKEIVFTGDVIFQGSIGRTDLPGGDLDVLIKTIKEKILTLPDETIIFAGHGYETTVGEEAKNNPFIREMINDKN